MTRVVSVFVFDFYLMYLLRFVLNFTLPHDGEINLYVKERACVRAREDISNIYYILDSTREWGSTPNVPNYRWIGCGQDRLTCDIQSRVQFPAMTLSGYF